MTWCIMHLLGQRDGIVGEKPLWRTGFIYIELPIARVNTIATVGEKKRKEKEIREIAGMSSKKEKKEKETEVVNKRAKSHNIRTVYSSWQTVVKTCDRATEQSRELLLVVAYIHKKRDCLSSPNRRRRRCSCCCSAERVGNTKTSAGVFFLQNIQFFF